jgi:hypothetical protein
VQPLLLHEQHDESTLMLLQMLVSFIIVQLIPLVFMAA